jgi:hypothetical protein
MSHRQFDAESDRQAKMASRRRLLKAAAAGAPLIATLPNGAAWATASTAQCIVSSRTASPQNVASDPPPAGDTFVRQMGREVQVGPTGSSDPATFVTVYTISPDNTTYYNADGSVYSSGGLPSGFQEKTATSKQLLRVFDATSDTGDPAGNPTGIANCGATPTPPRCIFPVDQVGSSGDNQPIYTSCLCSVTPGLVTGACRVP